MESVCYNRGVGTANPGIHLIVKGHDVTPLQEESYRTKTPSEKWTHLYDTCPDCGAIKTKRGKLCWECTVGPKPPADTCQYCGPSCEFGIGICHCGCGSKTEASQHTKKRRGLIKGKPNKFIKNHHRIQDRQQDETLILEGKVCVRLALTQGKFALVDANDYSRVKQFLWFSTKTKWTFYARSGKDGGNTYLHRFIMNLSDDELVVDHKNGNGLDNRKSNLRICSQSENGRNRSGASKLTRFKGICLNKKTGKWIATLNLGSFNTEEEAALAYDHALKYVFAEFGRPNFKEEEKCA
jgi:HNH endonuclease/AP2 domain